jgi:hypothetical protein
VFLHCQGLSVVIEAVVLSWLTFCVIYELRHFGCTQVQSVAPRVNTQERWSTTILWSPGRILSYDGRLNEIRNHFTVQAERTVYARRRRE